MKLLKKGAFFSDIHWGRKNGSIEHNTDCLNYIKWFCDNVKNDTSIDHVQFLGDWHEHRHAIDVSTLTYSYNGAKMLNDLGLPILFASGNHDQFLRNSSDIFSTHHLSALENFTVMNKVTYIDYIHGGLLFVPYISPSEYNVFLKYNNVPVVAGHLELNGFMLSGTSTRLEDGPDPEKFFKNQKRVFSGHFHKRDSKRNVHYIGNTFPMDFSDANDTERGMATYDFVKDELEFIDWADCPKYIKTKLSDLLESPKSVLEKGARVKVLVDQTISLTENNEIRKKLTERFGLRGIVLEEQIDTAPDLSDVEQEVEDLKLDTVAEIIPELLKRIKSDKIDAETLVSIYRSL